MLNALHLGGGAVVKIYTTKNCNLQLTSDKVAIVRGFFIVNKNMNTVYCHTCLILIVYIWNVVFNLYFMQIIPLKMFCTFSSSVSTVLYSTHICLPSRFCTTTTIHCCEDAFIRNYDSSSEIILGSINLHKYHTQIII